MVNVISDFLVRLKFAEPRLFAYQHIDAVSGLGPQFLSKALMGNKVLSETLRGTDVDIEFGTDETIPNLNSLSAIPSSQDYTKSGNGT